MSGSRKTDLISLILNIIATALMIFATIITIINIVGCKNALAGVTGDDNLANVRHHYGVIIIFAGMLSFGVSMALNLVGSMMYASNVGPSKRKNTIAFIRIIYVFVPMILGAALLAIFYFTCK